MKESFQVDPAHTVIGFSARHLGVTAVRGRFWRFSGWFIADRADLAGAVGEVAVEVRSLSTDEEQRDTHLRSPDFFDAETYPRMVYRLTGITPLADGTYVADGTLTIKETTQPLQLRARLEGETPDPFGGGGSRIGISAAGQVDRFDYGLTWDGLAGAVPMAGRTIQIQIDAELVASPMTTRAALEASAGMDAWLVRMNAEELQGLRRALVRMTDAVDARLQLLTGQRPANGGEPVEPPAKRRRWLGRS